MLTVSQRQFDQVPIINIEKMIFIKNVQIKHSAESRTSESGEMLKTKLLHVWISDRGKRPKPICFCSDFRCSKQLDRFG